MDFRIIIFIGACEGRSISILISIVNFCNADSEQRVIQWEKWGNSSDDINHGVKTLERNSSESFRRFWMHLFSQETGSRHEIILAPRISFKYFREQEWIGLVNISVFIVISASLINDLMLYWLLGKLVLG